MSPSCKFKGVKATEDSSLESILVALKCSSGKSIINGRHFSKESSMSSRCGYFSLQIDKEVTHTNDSSSTRIIICSIRTVIEEIVTIFKFQVYSCATETISSIGFG